MVCFINTHFDHESEEARTKAAELLVQQVPSVSKGLPTVVVGDLNCGEGSPALATLSGALIECSSAGCAVIDGMLGKCGTFVGFDKSIDSQIDFIFAAQGLKPVSYGTVPDECAFSFFWRFCLSFGGKGQVVDSGRVFFAALRVWFYPFLIPKCLLSKPHQPLHQATTAAAAPTTAP
jgi:hypothetical protein